VDLKPRGYDKVVRLLDKGVAIPNPLSLDIADDVDVDRISGDGVTVHPGCRIHGSRTAISAGCTLGAEGPVVLDDCRLGPGVDLKGGYFKRSVFLEKANMGLGAQVREGCLLEEEANGAHCVGLKQTILFPFVTLGSLINFCDCLMAGGTSRKDHSEVGSSYIHFNYTPDGDKTTASLFGDVPRGVMLDRPPIFLGGQGGAVGPVRTGFGVVIAAGSVLRADVLADERLVAAPMPEFERARSPHAYRNLVRVVRNNVVYLANLVALQRWYETIRAPFFAEQDLGSLVYEGALDVLASARSERTKRLMAMAAKVSPATAPARAFCEHVGEICGLFSDGTAVPDDDAFITAVHSARAAGPGNYTETIQGLPPQVREQGVQWLQRIVDSLCREADGLLGTMDLFD
jgi:UDP-N-acetylglucosamine/UDP-N-acetylgalactosamine diphosphorylase